MSKFKTINKSFFKKIFTIIRVSNKTDIPMKIGIIGCGNISQAYFTATQTF
ncbi:MAG: hypothetical protein SGI98_01560 [Verrucomicrobiota bacterium]|nr:hypothetical protein [Verrucomicrobiota bacterium]